MLYKDHLDILTRTYAQAAAIIRADSPMFDVHKLEVWYGGILEHLSTQSAPVSVTDLTTTLRRPKASNDQSYRPTGSGGVHNQDP